MNGIFHLGPKAISMIRDALALMSEDGLDIVEAAETVLRNNDPNFDRKGNKEHASIFNMLIVGIGMELIEHDLSYRHLRSQGGAGNEN